MERLLHKTAVATTVLFKRSLNSSEVEQTSRPAGRDRNMFALLAGEVFIAVEVTEWGN